MTSSAQASNDLDKHSVEKQKSKNKEFSNKNTRRERNQSYSYHTWNIYWHAVPDTHLAPADHHATRHRMQTAMCSDVRSPNSCTLRIFRDLQRPHTVASIPSLSAPRTRSICLRRAAGACSDGSIPCAFSSSQIRNPWSTRMPARKQSP